MKFLYEKTIRHEIDMDTEAVITAWKKIIAGYSVNNDWPNEEETKEILEDAFVDVLYYPPAGEKANYFLIDEDKWDISEIDGYYGTEVADACESIVAHYLQYWGLLS